MWVNRMKTLRVSKWLKDKYPLLTQRQREEAIETGLVLGIPAKKFLKKGEKISDDTNLNCEKLETHISKLKRGIPNEDIKVVSEKDGIVVIDKPSGIASQPISLFDENTVTQWARFHYPSINGDFPEPQPTLTPHRLDIGTSGVLIVALNQDSYLYWREQFLKKRVRKTYLAWCWGKPKDNNYCVDYSIAHAPGDAARMIALKGNVRYRLPVLKALSNMRVVRRVEEKNVFLAEINCSTGVTHQVRVHLTSLGFPILGDRLYDPLYEMRDLKREFHALRAVSLAVEDWYTAVDTEDFLEEN
ncbi:MAG: RNA pseudouridine synthase [Deltaproteobacteria bacterium]|nr:RNA pseudouridine synthase [Deltaproteobacteria bacterium]